MVVHIDLPQYLADLRVYRVNVGSLVGEVGDEYPIRSLVERDRAADAGLDLERPVNTPGLRVQGIHLSLGRCSVEAAAGHHRLCASRGRGREPEGPLQREARQVLPREP